jgi:hypothetical protein
VTFGGLGVLGRTLDCSTIVSVQGISATFINDDNCRPRGRTRPRLMLLGLLGIGAQYQVLPRLALRAELQGGFAAIVPIGVRVAGAVAIPLGATRQSDRRVARHVQ